MSRPKKKQRVLALDYRHDVMPKDLWFQLNGYILYTHRKSTPNAVIHLRHDRTSCCFREERNFIQLEIFTDDMYVLVNYHDANGRDPAHVLCRVFETARPARKFTTRCYHMACLHCPAPQVTWGVINPRQLYVPGRARIQL